MMRLAAKFPRAVMNGIRPSSFSLLKPPPPPPQFIKNSSFSSCAFTPNPVAVEMIKYATSLARDQNTEESYGRGLLILEQCESTHPDDDSKGLVELARSTLLFESGSHEAAIDRLGKLQDLSFSSIAVKVAASEALVGIYLEQYQENAASAVADLALQILGSIKRDIDDGDALDILEARVKSLKGLIEVTCGNLETAQSVFEGSHGENFSSIGNAALNYGEFLHGMRKFSNAEELYTKVIQSMYEIKDSCDLNSLGACNMTPEEVEIAATCALGQLKSHMGNFSDAEEILTTALKKTEERFGPHHPKVGVILTCIALMYRLKAVAERSSSLLIQEGLFRRALELLKAPPLDVDDASKTVVRKDIISLARGGYAEALEVQQSRKAEGERLRKWAEGAWGNRWISLADALALSESSPRVPVIDTRICRAI